ncbi:acetyl-CoA C-acyltransferase [Chitinophagaceae bacterium MMS25-I14]
MKEVFIVAAKRTPVGGLMGSLSSLSATQLGAIAIKDAYTAAGIAPELINEVYMGNVLSANLGQSPARQAGIFAGIPAEADATTINKVCASGMKATAIGAQQIQLGLSDIVATGGMESMSNVPHYSYIRAPHKYGHTTLTDGMIKDGLWDVYNDFHMGSAAELAVKKYGLSREAQDEYALSSYEKATRATKEGKFSGEITAVTIQQKSGSVSITEDEDIYKIIPEKISKLAPAFEKDGTITAANASNLNDGAAALMLASADAVKQYNLKPITRIISYADAAQAPEWFTTSPSLAIPKALKRAGLTLNDIDFFEINEAYAAVILANSRILDIDINKINLYGGAVAIGHPIGASGARILTTLTSVLSQEGGRYGVAAICNGGGGATAMVIERL